MRKAPSPNLRAVLLLLSLLFGAAPFARCQISFSSAIDLAVRNSPRVKMAQDDAKRAQAALAEAKDVFIPSIVSGGGYGESRGITLNLPTIFTASAQSLVFSYSQRDYIRSSRAALQAANLSLADIREQVEEDAANTYLALDRAQQRQAAMADELRFAQKLVVIVQDRLDAGLETPMELKKTRRAAVQIELQQLNMEDEVAVLRDHLGRLMGVPAERLTTVTGSIPPDSAFTVDPVAQPAAPLDTFSVLAAKANAQSKLQQAFGDERYTHRPQLTFAAQYGRVSQFNGVSKYYTGVCDDYAAQTGCHYNTVFAGVSLTIPFFDKAHAAHARETMADAMHAIHAVDALRDQESESRLRLTHSLAELSKKAELADIDRGIAQDQLSSILLQLNGAGPPSMTPKDEQNARIQIGQRQLELLDADLALRQAEISLLRQTGKLQQWVQSLTNTQMTLSPKP